MAFVTPEPRTAGEKSRHIIRLLEEHGQDDYIGEDISQLEHCLQAADQAKRAGSRDEVRPTYTKPFPSDLALRWTWAP